MTTTITGPHTADPTPAPSPASLGRSFLDWLLKRGFLWGMTQTPLLAILGGLFYRAAPYPIMALPMFASFVALPIWISYRRKVSTDPDEPVHHLHKYALWALVPAAMFSVSRIPLHYLIGIIYWHPWYDFGNALTRTPLGGQDTLAVGGLLNAIQGWAMGLGFYILFKRHSLMNVLLYIAVWVSALYSYDFADYSRIGLGSPPYWHASMAWAHWWMALTLWFIPRFHQRTWPSLSSGRRAASVAVGALILVTPSVFAQWRAVTWEFPRETRIDTALFNRPNLVTLKGTPSLVSTGADARYGFTLQVGPRDYRNWFKQLRALDVSDVHVTGSLAHNGQMIAWCDTAMAGLPTPNLIGRPLDFPPAMRALRFTSIPITCRGPAAAALALQSSPQVTVQWNAQMTLIGGRERQARQFTGAQTMPVSLAS